jgi:DNA-binding transcriptional regulator YiaG
MLYWQYIKDFENYKINADGEIHSVSRNDSIGRYRKGKKLSTNLNKWGYEKVVLCKNGKPYTKSVHRLVAIHFIQNPKNKPQVNHKDGNKLNNKDSNLEWVTAKENQQHAVANGLYNLGEKHHNSKLTIKDIKEIRKSVDMTQRKLAKKYGVGQRTIVDILQRKTWKHI